MAVKNIGIVIGNNYLNSNKELKFAIADAEKIKEILENKDICEFDQVDYFPDKTSKEVSLALEKTFRRADIDQVFIYYSGHGKKDFENNLCLLFKDTEEDSLLTTSLPFDFIIKCTKYPPRKSVIIVLDCCYSGAAGTRDADTDITKSLKRNTGSGTIILTSTGLTGSPTAREDANLGHGIFTHYLIEGLEKGLADQNNDGLISIDELYDYVYKKTTENCTQSPKREGRIEGTFLIGRNPNKIKENECKFKTEKLLKFVGQLPPRIFDESLKILTKKYGDPSSMEKSETDIYKQLEFFLEGELSIETYTIIMKHLKERSTNERQINLREGESIQNKEIEEFRRQKEEERKAREQEEQERLRRQQEDETHIKKIREDELLRKKEEEEENKRKEIREREKLRRQQEEAAKNIEEIKRKAIEEAERKNKEEKEAEKKLREEQERKRKEIREQEKLRRQQEEAAKNIEETKRKDMEEAGKELKEEQERKKIELEDGNSKEIQLENMGLAYHSQGEYKKAIGCYESALKIAKKLGDRNSEQTQLANLGLAYYYQGESKKKKIKSGRFTSNDWDTYHYQDEYEKAIGCYESALKIAKELGNRSSEQTQFSNLGLVYSDMGESRKAIECYEQSLKIAKDLVDSEGINNCESKIKALRPPKKESFSNKLFGFLK